MRRKALAVLAGVTTLALLAACHHGSIDPKALQHVTWTAVQVNGKQVLAPPPLLRLWDGHVSGYTGCNAFGGVYSVEGDKITFTGGVLDQRRCIPPIMAQEHALMPVVNGTPTFAIEGGTLALRSSEGEVVFSRNPPSPSPTPVPTEYADSSAQNLLLRARNTAGGYTVGNDSYEGFGPTQAADYDPTLVWSADPVASVGEVSLRVVSPRAVLLVTASSSGKVFCLAYDSKTGPAGTTFGTTDAQTVEQCSKPEWPKPRRSDTQG